MLQNLPPASSGCIWKPARIATRPNKAGAQGISPAKANFSHNFAHYLSPLPGLIDRGAP